MNYDEDLLVELIASGDVSQTEIAERVGVSRRTVWRIANGQSRPNLQRKIAATVEGYRRETIRLAARFMKPILKKQIEVALEGDGETARKCREFLLKTFMIDLPRQTDKKPRPVADDDDGDAKKPLNPTALYKNLAGLSPDLKRKVVEELGGPCSAVPATQGEPCDSDAPAEVPVGVNDGKEEATVLPSPPAPRRRQSDLSRIAQRAQQEAGSPVATPVDDSVTDPPACKQTPDPFGNLVDGPFGKKVYAESIRLVEEAKAAAATIPTRRRVKRAPNPYQFP